jgi:hypothetical protein
MGLRWLSSEQREKINDLVRGKFYKITPPAFYSGLPVSRREIEIGRFLHVVNAHSDPTSRLEAELVFGMPAFTQRDVGDPCSYEGPVMGEFNIPVSWIDNIVPIDAPEGAGADWVPSVFCGGARKTRRGRASRSKRSKRGSRRK